MRASGIDTAGGGLCVAVVGELCVDIVVGGRVGICSRSRWAGFNRSIETVSCRPISTKLSRLMLVAEGAKTMRTLVGSLCRKSSRKTASSVSSPVQS